MGQPPFRHLERFKMIDVELTLRKSLLKVGASGDDPLVLAETDSVRSPTPKSFRAWR